jgi:hypothetical protein
MYAMAQSLLVRHSVKIKPGYRTVIRLIPSQVIATDALHDLPEEDRKCRLPNENGNSQLFDFYSQNATAYPGIFPGQMHSGTTMVHKCVICLATFVFINQ